MVALMPHSEPPNKEKKGLTASKAVVLNWGSVSRSLGFGGDGGQDKAPDTMFCLDTMSQNEAAGDHATSISLPVLHGILRTQ